MYRFTKAAFNLTGRAVRQVRQSSSSPAEDEFHRKYGSSMLVGGVAFCTAVWAYVFTQTGIVWNFSPVGKVMPQPWREPEDE